jgi:hypothetical protein
MMPKLPLDEMTMEEKLQTMELLWDSLCRDKEPLVSPAWHGEVLAAREAAIERGDAVFEDFLSLDEMKAKHRR